MSTVVGPADHAQFVELIETMNRLGCRFIVRLPDQITYDGPELPVWVDRVIDIWFDFILHAYVGCRSLHHVYICRSCSFPMLLTSDRNTRTCPCCGTVGGIDRRLRINFANRPKHMKRRATT